MQYLEMTAASETGQLETRAVVAAASSQATKPDRSAKVAAVGLLIGGVVAGAVLTEIVNPDPFVPAEGIGIFAVFYVAAQALERVFEVLRVLFPAPTGGSDETKAEVQAKCKIAQADGLEALKAGDEVTAQEKAQDAADAEAKEEKIQRNTSLIAWGVNSFLAALLAGGLGLFLLEVVGLKGVHRWADIAVTSLVIGGGTKPLHDLIKNLEKSKDGEKSN